MQFLFGACTPRKETVASDFHATQVFIVDDELPVRKMLAVMLRQAGVSCTPFAGADEVLQALQSQPVDAIISDLRMGRTSGMELLEEVHRKYPAVAFLMATGVSDVRVGVQAMKQGADDYLVKPFDVDVVLASLERALKKKSLEQEVQSYRQHLEEMVAERTKQLHTAMARLQQSYSGTLEALGSVMDLRDSPTAGHCRRVLWYSMKLAETIGGLQEQHRTIAIGAWLHDIGKLAIPDGILLKPGPLNEQEREVMQRHVAIGYDLVKGIPFLSDAAEVILAHHERCDGSGYPRALRGEEIPISAKIFAVADTLDAMTSDRPYRAALPFNAARDVIGRAAGTLFDPIVTAAFLSVPEETWALVRAEAASLSIGTILVPSVAADSEFDSLNQLQTYFPSSVGIAEGRGAICQPKPSA